MNTPVKPGAVTGDRADEVMLTDFTAMPDGGQFTFEGGVIAEFAAAFVDQFHEIGAENYVCMTLQHKGEEYTVTLQKKSGKTPADLRDAAIARAESAEAQRDANASRADAMESALRSIQERLASVGFPANSKGQYAPWSNDWCFSVALPREVDAEEVEKAFRTARAALAEGAKK